MTVDIVTRYRLYSPLLESRQEQVVFLFSKTPRPPSLLFNRYRVSFSELKRPGREFDNSPSSSAVVMNECSYISTPHMPSWCGQKQVRISIYVTV
jgi:hypothetical protein